MRSKDSADYARRDHFTPLLFGLLLLVPVVIASQAILNRKLRTINTFTISCYANPTKVIILFVAMFSLDIDYHQFIVKCLFQRDKTELILFLWLGLNTVMGQILKFKAYQHLEASKLAVLSYLKVVYYLGFDVFLINAVISQAQWFGLSLILVGYMLKCRDAIFN